MNRPFLIAFIGIVVVAFAIGLNFLPSQPDAPPQPPPVAKAPEPVPEPKPAETMQPAPPTFDVVRVNPDGNAVIAGRAIPDSVVVNIDNGTEFGRVEADDRGEWVFVPEKPLTPGSHTLRLKMLVGPFPPVNSVDDVVVVVAERGKDIAGRSGDSSALALKVAPDGSSSVLQKPGRKSSIKLSVDVVDYDDNGRLFVSGNAQPLTMIQIYLDNRFIGHARTGEDKGEGSGAWSMKPDDPVKPGLYTLRADQVDNGGKVIQRVEFPFSRAEATPELTTLLTARKNTIVVQPGNSLWRIARTSYGEGTRFSVIYEANADQISDPDLIYPGQVFKLPENE